MRILLLVKTFGHEIENLDEQPFTFRLYTVINSLKLYFQLFNLNIPKRRSTAILQWTGNELHGVLNMQLFPVTKVFRGPIQNLYSLLIWAEQGSVITQFVTKQNSFRPQACCPSIDQKCQWKLFWHPAYGEKSFFCNGQPLLCVSMMSEQMDLAYNSQTVFRCNWLFTMNSDKTLH